MNSPKTDPKMFGDLRPVRLVLPDRAKDRVVQRARQTDDDGNARMTADMPRWRPFVVVPGKDVEEVAVVAPDQPTRGSSAEPVSSDPDDLAPGTRPHRAIEDVPDDHPGWNSLAMAVGIGRAMAFEDAMRRVGDEIERPLSVDDVTVKGDDDGMR